MLQKGKVDMALTTCSECNKEMSTTAKVCPNCGATQNTSSGAWRWWVGIPLVLFIVMIVAGQGGDKQKAQSRAAIDLCWNEQERKSLDPSGARFIAGACERMESEFIQKYGHKP